MKQSTPKTTKVSKPKKRLSATAVKKTKPTNKCGHSTKSTGRPKLLLDARQVENLASIGTPVKKIAEFFSCAESTINLRFSEALKAGRQKLDEQLRQTQLFVAIEQLDSKMLVWLGKQYLNQRDKIESEVTHVGEINMLTQD